MIDFRIEAEKCVKQLSVFDKNHPLINNKLFLRILEREYSDVELYEVASIIHTRIMLMESKEDLGFFEE